MKKDEAKVVDLTSAENMEEQDNDEYDYEDEDFGWFTESIKDQTYFAFVNCDRRTIEKGEQVFYCYGKRTNAFLLLK